ncbi:MAG: hypothetical protein AAB439_01310 [Patescibacteria group bacterium]
MKYLLAAAVASVGVMAFLGDVNETIQEREMFLSLFTWDLI